MQDMKRLSFLQLAAMLLAAACSDGSGKELPPDPPDPEPEPQPVHYAIGDHYKVGTAEGIVCQVDDTGQHGMIVSLDEAELMWSTEEVDLGSRFGNFSLTDGLANVECIKTLENWGKKYPAFKWCDAKNALSRTHWYLPALYEMAEVYAAFNGGPSEPDPEPDATRAETAQERFNRCLTEAGGTPLSIDDYWTSTEFGTQAAYPYSFLYGDYATYDTGKTSVHRVRAVRRF